MEKNDRMLSFFIAVFAARIGYWAMIVGGFAILGFYYGWLLAAATALLSSGLLTRNIVNRNFEKVRKEQGL